MVLFVAVVEPAMQRWRCLCGLPKEMHSIQCPVSICLLKSNCSFESICCFRSFVRQSYQKISFNCKLNGNVVMNRCCTVNPLSLLCWLQNHSRNSKLYSDVWGYTSYKECWWVQLCSRYCGGIPLFCELFIDINKIGNRIIVLSYSFRLSDRCFARQKPLK